LSGDEEAKGAKGVRRQETEGFSFFIFHWYTPSLILPLPLKPIPNFTQLPKIARVG
jgi:hypothetical protein